MGAALGQMGAVEARQTLTDTSRVNFLRGTRSQMHASRDKYREVHLGHRDLSAYFRESNSWERFDTRRKVLPYEI